MWLSLLATAMRGLVLSSPPSHRVMSPPLVVRHVDRVDAVVFLLGEVEFGAQAAFLEEAEGRGQMQG
jgi:hypothetical protein